MMNEKNVKYLQVIADLDNYDNGGDWRNYELPPPFAIAKFIIDGDTSDFEEEFNNLFKITSI